MCSDPNMKTTLRRGEVSAVCYEHTGEPMCLHLRQPAFPSRDPGVLAPPVTARTLSGDQSPPRSSWQGPGKGGKSP